jgi:transposase-like protein
VLDFDDSIPTISFVSLWAGVLQAVDLVNDIMSFPPQHGHVTCVDSVSTGKEVAVPAPHPIEFRQRAVELARKGDKPVAQLAKDLGISESCLRNWMSQADTDDNGGAKLTSAEKKELAELRKKARQLELENEILKRAAAYFARENVLPK